jgi:hypothetical protein
MGDISWSHVGAGNSSVWGRKEVIVNSKEFIRFHRWERQDVLELRVNVTGLLKQISRSYKQTCNSAEWGKSSVILNYRYVLSLQTFGDMIHILGLIKCQKRRGIA